MKISHILMLFLSISLTAGCSTFSRKDGEKGPIPRTGPTVEQLYRGQAAPSAGAASTHARPINNGDVDLRGYTRESHTELRQLFPRARNPVLVTYVFPHVTQGGLPVPGYSTAFRMYATDSFALPGEQPMFESSAGEAVNRSNR